MRKELQHIELIEKYLTGILSQAEKNAFEESMNASPALQREVMLQQQIMERIQLNAFVADVKVFHDKKASENPWWKTAFNLNTFLITVCIAGATWAGYSWNVFDETHTVVNPTPAKAITATHAISKTSGATALAEETQCTKKTTPVKKEFKKEEEVIEPVKEEENEIFSTEDTSSSSTGNEQVPLINFSVPYVTKSINPAKDNHIFIKGSGSVVHIPANALVYKDGSPVKGSVRIKYREYRHAGEMAFSHIPMMYHETGKEYMYSSAGMFELRGWQANKEIYIKPGSNVTVDFRMNYANDSLHFFALNDKTNEWKMLPDALKPVNDTANTSSLFDKSIHAPKRKKPEKRFMDFLHRLFVRNREVARDRGEFSVADTIQHERKTGTKSTLLGDGTIKDKGHTYPAMVKGLNCPEFGVYNCDQIYRLADKIQIHANYTDEKGKPIKSINVLSLVDMRYNGAFSFDPANFTCSKSGRNVLLLFTHNNKLYALTENEWKAMNIKAGGDYTFKMKDISAEVKSPAALKKFLGLDLKQ
jgi:hypothetical protein